MSKKRENGSASDDQPGGSSNADRPGIRKIKVAQSDQLDEMLEDDKSVPRQNDAEEPRKKDESTVVYSREELQVPTGNQSGGDTTVVYRPGDTSIIIAPDATIRSRLLSRIGDSTQHVIELPIETLARQGRQIMMGEDGQLVENAQDDVPDYEIIHRINQGGMGVIFAAIQRSLRREIALKIWRSKKKITDPVERKRRVAEFTKEAFMTASLDHPNIVPIYELARDAEGRPFFSMKRVSGLCWKDLLHPNEVKDIGLRQRAEAQAKRMNWRDHLEILLKVCDAVAFAHSKSIIHRDLKPANIMIGEFGEVYVMDWGLSMYIDERSEYRKNPGLAPELAGTPCYMAPEMARREVDRFCPATDVYLLGGILYEFLTGEAPHRGRTVDEVVQDASRGNVSPPEWVTDSKLVNPAISAIVMKALSPDIRDRYPNVLAFQRDLRNYLAHAESLTLSTRAAVLLDYLKKELIQTPSEVVPDITPMDKDGAGIAYSRLWDCINTFRQALNLWESNGDARQGLLTALTLQIKLALEQGDLTMAESQFRYLEELQVSGSYDVFSNRVQSVIQELGLQLTEKRKEAEQVSRSARNTRRALASVAAVLIAGVAFALIMVEQQRKQAVQNQEVLFASAVDGRARLLEQYIQDLENTVNLYRERAVQLMSMPEKDIPLRPTTPAGRDGYYYDEDFYDQLKKPSDMKFHAWYGREISLSVPTVVRAPWARSGEGLKTAEKDAKRLSRMDELFSIIHRSRNDIRWSIAGAPSGLLVGFPGSGRYGDKPDYDPTQRAWFKAGFQADTDDPVWGDPYADASTRKLIISLVARVKAEERMAGVVGIELELDAFKNMLKNFSLLPGRDVRSLLVKPVILPHSKTGDPVLRHRIIVDTNYELNTSDWRETIHTSTIEDLGGAVEAYFKGIQEGKYKEGSVTYRDNRMFTFSRFIEHNWLLIVYSESVR